jgi:hypothetical protein
MSMFSCTKATPEDYIIVIMNSKLSALYIDSFINSTSHCTTGDAKLLIIKIPTINELSICKTLFDKAYELKKSVAKGEVSELLITERLEGIETEINIFISKLYDINV